MSQELDKRTLIIIIMMILIFGFFFVCLFVCLFFLFENDFNLRMLKSYTLIENDHAGEHSNKTMRQN